MNRNDVADALRRTIGLRRIIRFRPCASRLTVKRVRPIRNLLPITKRRTKPLRGSHFIACFLGL